MADRSDAYLTALANASGRLRQAEAQVTQHVVSGVFPGREEGYIAALSAAADLIESALTAPAATDTDVTVTLTRQHVQMLIDAVDFDVLFPENKRIMEDACSRLYTALED